jgi:hypothetical protein
MTRKKLPASARRSIVVRVRLLPAEAKQLKRLSRPSETTSAALRRLAQLSPYSISVRWHEGACGWPNRRCSCPLSSSLSVPLPPSRPAEET